MLAFSAMKESIFSLKSYSKVNEFLEEAELDTKEFLAEIEREVKTHYQKNSRKKKSYYSNTNYSRIDNDLEKEIINHIDA